MAEADDQTATIDQDATTPPVAIPDLSSLDTERRAELKSYQESTDRAVKAQRDASDAELRMADDEESQIDALSQMKPPVNHMQDVMKGAPFLMILSAIGGHLAKADGMAMLKGMTGMMNGLTAGTKQAYDDAYEQFNTAYAQQKQRVELMSRVNKERLDAYKGRADAELLAAKAAHDVAGETYKNEQQILQNLKTQQNMQLQLDKLAEEIRNHKAVTDSKNKGADPASIENRAQMIAKYQLPPPTPYEMARNPSVQTLMERVVELNPDYQANEFTSRTKAYKDFATGKQGQLTQSSGVALAHLETMQKLVEALDNGDIRGINAAKQLWEKETGSTAPTNFDAAKRIVADEIVKFIVGGNSALGDRETAQATFSRANSYSQLVGVMETYKQLLGGQLAGLEQTYKNSTGRDDFQTRLQPRARKYYGDNRDYFMGLSEQSSDDTKVIDGKTYVKKDGKWYEQ